MKTLSKLFCCVSTAILFAFTCMEAKEEAHIIDFGSFKKIESGYYTQFDIQAWKYGHYAFNYAPELTPVFAKLVADYNIDTIVETGTCKGGTTVAFAMLVNDVHTIEVVEETYSTSKTRLKDNSNVHCYLGNSEEVLSYLLPSLANKRVMFYLDAHWYSNWPLLKELEEISKTHKDNCIIVIDDFKVPGRSDIPYDAYGPQECSIEYIKDQLKGNFSSYALYYLIPNSVNSHAKAIIVPSHWK